MVDLRRDERQTCLHRRRRDEDRVQGARLGAHPVGERSKETSAERRRDRVVGHLGGHPLRVDVRGDHVPGRRADDDCPRP
jgi:hypothetical protein